MKKIRLWFLLWLVGMAAGVPAFGAQRVLVILSDDTPPYQAVLQSLDRELLPPRFQVHAVLASRLDTSAAQNADLAITLGVQATESLERLPLTLRVLAALVPRDWYAMTGHELLARRREVDVLFIDQPLRRQLDLVRAVLPQARTIGVVVSQQRTWQLPQLDGAAHALGLRINVAVVGQDQGLVAALEKVLPDSDVLLALPDPDIFNSATAQTIFLTAYRYRVPVVGYSEALTRAGALVSIYSTPDQLGEQAAELALHILNGRDKALPPQYPTDYSISANGYVARSLGVELPDLDVVKKNLLQGSALD